MNQRGHRGRSAVVFVSSCLVAGALAAQELPPTPRFCIPFDVLPDEATAIYVYGEGYAADTRITIEGVGELLDQFVYNSELIIGFAPPLDPENPNQPPGLKSLTAQTGAVIVGLQNGVLYVGYGEPYLKYCWPSEVAPEGGTLIHFYGRNFREGLVPGFESPDDPGVQYLCTDPQLVGPDEMTAISSAIPAGPAFEYYTGILTEDVGGPTVTQRLGMLAVYEGTLQPVLTAVEPGLVNARGGSFVTVRGQGLRNDFRTSIFVSGSGVFIGGLEERVLDDGSTLVESIDGLAPRMDALDPATPPGFYDVVYRDPRGESILPGALRYVDRIESVAPPQVFSDGGELVTFEGFDFDETFVPYIGDAPLVDAERIDSTRWTGKAPPLAPDLYPARFLDATGTVVEGFLPAAIEVLPSPNPAIASVEPTEVSIDGGTTVTFLGSRFHGSLTPRLGGVPLLSPTVIDSEHFAGTTPDFPLGGVLDADLVDGDGNVVASLASAVVVVTPPPIDAVSILGVSQAEGTLAEGTARFEWVNPIAASSIRVLDAEGALLQTLPGDQRLLNVPVDASLDEISLFFQSEFADGNLSNITPVFARRSGCLWPPPLTGIDRKGDVELVLSGGNFLGDPSRCAAPTEFVPIPDLSALGLQRIRDYSFGAANAGGGAVHTGVGALISNFTLASIAKISDDPKLKYIRRLATSQFTGFRLDRDADKLQIDAFYSMPVFAFDLKLKGRLIHVFPEDGFEDTFTFPDIQPSSIKREVGITYFRASHDVLDPAARSCGLKIPAGDYVLELYAEGGDPNTAHFILESDGRNEEIVIPGVPCPPYPRVKVTNLTGSRSLPVITKITGREVGAGLSIAPKVQLTAHGYWLDEAGVEHSLNPDDVNSVGRKYAPHDFIFAWTIYDRQQAPTTGAFRGTSRYDGIVRTVGCYEVDLELRDPDCPRKVRRTFEVVVVPSNFQCNSEFYSVLNPVPDPASVRAVVGFGSIPQGLCTPPRRRESFKVFVVPEPCCRGDIDCPAVKPEYLEFRLASGGQVVYTVPAGDIEDLCQNLQKGPKYLKVTVDVDRIGLLPGGDAGNFVDVWLEAKTKLYYDPGRCGVPPCLVSDNWHPVGAAMRMTNRPAALATSYSTVSYSKLGGSYQVILQSSRDAMHRLDPIPSSKSLELFSGIPGATIPEFPSDVNSGMNTAMQIIGESGWKPADAASSIAGKVLGNSLDGLPSTTAGREILGQAKERLEWVWSESKTILSNHIQQQLFQSIIFTGTIGPIPVTVWGSVSLALGIDVDAIVNVKVAPFAPVLDGGSYFVSQYDVRSKLTVSLPAELRTDILFGVASLTLSLIVEAIANFDVTLKTVDTELRTMLRLYADLNIKLAAKLCLFWFLCLPTIEVPLVRETIIDYTKSSGGGGGGDAGPPVQALAGSPRGGAGDTVSLKELLSVPASAVTPDGNQVMNLYYNAKIDRLRAELSTLNADGSVTVENLGIGAAELLAPGPFDVAAAFIRNDRALIVATATYPTESSVPFPLPAGAMPPRVQLNELKAQDEVVLCRFGTGVPSGDIDTKVVRLADPPDEVAAAERRADGRPAIAGNAPFQDAIAAWVRIEDREYLVDEDTTTTIYEANQTPSGIRFTEQNPRTTRPRLETAAIYTRRVNFDGVVDAPRKISMGGINVQPAIAFSPNGNAAYCVWVNDPTNLDLIRSNRGRNLVYSVWTRATDSWSEPQPVIALPDDFPGVLEPSIALKGPALNGTARGLLTFNALPNDALERDTGLNGTNRFVYLARLENGQFGTPVLVHGVCAKRIVGRYQTIHVGPVQKPNLGIKDPSIYFDSPGYILTLQQTGAQGHLDGSGNILVAAVQEQSLESVSAMPILTDNRTHTNVVGSVWNAGINTLNLKGGFAQVAVGGGGGLPEDVGYETVPIRFEPDLAIVACKLSEQFPGPGARVKATVEIENRGLAGSATDETGQSLTALRIVYTRVDGRETIEADEPVEVLLPGERTLVEAVIEMPLDPVRLRVEITPNPGDRDPSNDVQGCFFGAPEPQEFACEVSVAPHESGDLLVSLSWRNPAGFDELLLWRDGEPLAALPGTSKAFMDHEAAPGLHLYEIRSRIGVSKSCRVKLDCVVVPPPPPEGEFRRGDVDTNGSLDITDAIALLGHLFLGGNEPACFDGADADDSGVLDITDGIKILGYLFLAGSAPPAPGPDNCGRDPTADDLAPCESCGA